MVEETGVLKAAEGVISNDGPTSAEGRVKYLRSISKNGWYGGAVEGSALALARRSWVRIQVETFLCGV